MKLKEFQVLRFRNIIDSTPIPVEGDVTVLVGKNESGKTALLEALYRLNPIYASSFSLSDDYPRWRFVADRRKGESEKAAPIAAVFTIEESDREAVETALGPGLLGGDEVTVSRKYGNPRTTWWQFSKPIDEAKALTNMVDSLGVSERTKSMFAGAAGLAAVATAADAARAQLKEEENTEAVLVELDKIAARAKALLGDSDDAAAAVRKVLLSRLPRFFYFSSYHLLPGRIDLNELAKSAQEEPAASPEQTAKSLLRLAETTPEALMGEQYEERKAELEAVSNDLSRQVFEYWTQNPDLRVEFDLDRQIEPDKDGVQRIVGNHLEVRVQDRRHDFTNNFSQRSSGFRWFFSFLAAFTEFEGVEKNVVVLLDEPGLTLHAKAQADFLRFINERLAADTQVIYTTHSPFMLETDRIERARIVQDRGPDVGTTVTTDVLAVDRDSVFPLQAALGYDLTQHLLIGDANLLVEGSSDFVYLDSVSRFLRNNGRTGLEQRLRILPAGGSSNVPAFVALLGNKMDVTVLVDSGTEGKQRIQSAITAGRFAADRLVTVSEITGTKNADIEDLFEPVEYVDLYNTAFGTSLNAMSLPPGDRIVKRIETTEGHSFDHFSPAEVLLRDQTTRLKLLSSGTLDRFESLFERINKTVSK